MSAPDTERAHRSPTVKRQRTRAERRRARARVRLLLAFVLLVSGVVVVLTDLHGRSEVGQNLQALAAARHRLDRTHVALVREEAQTQSAYNEIDQLESSTADDRATVTTTNGAITTAEVGIFFDGISLPTLNTCLTGVFQVLDQIDVGQAASGLSELGLLSPICSAVTP